MSITLYGSLPSPYVRRVRLFLEGVDYQFKPLNVYDDAERAEYAAITPIRKLPLLVDGDTPVFDSHVICEHVRKLRGLPEFSIAEHNLVSVVDAATDSMIILFMGKRSELPVDSSKLLFKLQLERLPDTLAWLNQQAEQGAFDDWSFATIALISLLDWAEFRSLYEFSDYPALLAARDKHAQREIVKATMPE